MLVRAHQKPKQNQNSVAPFTISLEYPPLCHSSGREGLKNLDPSASPQDDGETVHLKNQSPRCALFAFVSVSMRGRGVITLTVLYLIVIIYPSGEAEKMGKVVS